MYNKVIAVTGGFCSGKSTFCNFLAQFGLIIISADTIAHELLTTSEELKEKIKSQFGNGVFTEHEIDRKKLGSIVFKDQNKKLQLENLMHPRIRESALEKFKNNTAPIIYEVPLFFESGLWKLPFLKVVSIVIEPKIAIQRAELRGYNAEQAKQRIGVQVSNIRRIRGSDYVVYNNLGVIELKNEAEVFFRSLA